MNLKVVSIEKTFQAIRKDEITLGDDRQNKSWAPVPWTSLHLKNQRKRRVTQ